MKKKLFLVLLAALFTATFIEHSLSHENYGKDNCQICRLGQSTAPPQAADDVKLFLPWSQLFIPSTPLISFDISYPSAQPRAPPAVPA
ncbi:MAG: hypothetical protein LHV69_02260 [Elusimicrobia bacterium]|nr:hypothetical protein [Candidatus Obscuribacterium magneticum]MCB4755850.1 hypothetical protein [Candidatus Obscuribacterium magneticum]